MGILIESHISRVSKWLEMSISEFCLLSLVLNRKNSRYSICQGPKDNLMRGGGGGGRGRE